MAREGEVEMVVDNLINRCRPEKYLGAEVIFPLRVKSQARSCNMIRWGKSCLVGRFLPWHYCPHIPSFPFNFSILPARTVR